MWKQCVMCTNIDNCCEFSQEMAKKNNDCTEFEEIEGPEGFEGPRTMADLYREELAEAEFETPIPSGQPRAIGE